MPAPAQKSPIRMQDPPFAVPTLARFMLVSPRLYGASTAGPRYQRYCTEGQWLGATGQLVTMEAGRLARLGWQSRQMTQIPQAIISVRMKSLGWGGFFTSSAHVQLFNMLTANLDFTFVPTRCGEVIRKLHSQPRLRRAAKSLR